MPLAPTPVMAMPTSKPKIGFSIDSIVGTRTSKPQELSYSQDSDNSENPASPLSECGSQTNDQLSSFNLSVDIKRALRLPPTSPEDLYNRLSKYQQQPHHTKTDIVNKSPSPRLTSEDSQPIRLASVSPTQQQPPPPPPPAAPPSSLLTKAPIIVPGIPASYVRPFAPSEPFKAIPPYHPSDLVQPHNTHLLAAAQFTAAAALANHSFPPGHQPQHLQHPNMARDSYPLYPWLLSRHGRIFPHRFPGSKSTFYKVSIPFPYFRYI